MRTTLALPEETYGSSRPRTVWTLLSLLAFLFLMANVVLVGMLRWYRMEASTETEVVAGKWRHLAGTDLAYDILLVGDSSGLIGVDPRVIAERTGMTCYNACGFGDLLAVNESWLIQHLESLGRLPRVVVSVHVADLWHRSEGKLRQQLSLFPEDVRPWERYLPHIKLPREGFRQRINRWLPLVRTPMESRTALVSLGMAFMGRSESRTDAWGMSRLPVADPQRTEREAHGYLDRLEANDSEGAELSKVNREAYDAMLDVLDRHGARLLAVESPTVDLLSRSPLYQAQLERNRVQLTALAGVRAGFRWAATGRTGYPARQMQNSDHIADAGTRMDFSQQVAEHLLKAMHEWELEVLAP